MRPRCRGRGLCGIRPVHFFCDPRDWSGICRTGGECRRAVEFGPDYVVDSLAALMRAMELKTRDEVVELVENYSDLTGWIDWSESDHESLVVYVNQNGTGLVYPFTIGELFETVDELDQLAYQQYEAEEGDEDGDGDQEDDEEEEATSQRRHT